MRNLKKFLALVLAMVMTFSLMLTANAIDYDKYTDKDAVTEEFEEAVAVLSGLKIMEGDGPEDAKTFRPGDYITRAEAAAVVYRAVTGDVTDRQSGLYADYGSFTDVKSDDWFAGYVGYCANQGIIKGNTPTTFNPYGRVTGYEALAMILRAVGYGKNNEFTGGSWQVNVASLARQLGVTRHVVTAHMENTLNMSAPREVVADLIFMTIATVPTVTYTPALAYNDKQSIAGADSSIYNPTLGQEVFGLHHDFAWNVVDQWGNPGYKWYRGGVWNGSSVTDTFNGKGYMVPANHPIYWTNDVDTVATISQKADYETTQQVRECDVAAALDFDGERVFRLYVNQRTSLTDTYRVVATDTVTKVGGQGRLTKVYFEMENPWFTDDVDNHDMVVTMVDTMLALVTNKTACKTDAAGHIITPAQLEVTIYDGMNTTNVAGGDNVNSVSNRVITKGSADKANWDEYSVGDYILLNAYTDKAHNATTTGVTNVPDTVWDVLGNNTIRNTQALLEEAAFRTNKVVTGTLRAGTFNGAAPNVWVLQKSDSIQGKQTVTSWNTGKHTVDGTDYDDQICLFLDRAGRVTNTTFTWYFDQYKNLIGIGDAHAVNYGVITSIYSAQKQGETDTTGAVKAIATVKFADGTTGTVEIDRFLMSWGVDLPSYTATSATNVLTLTPGTQLVPTATQIFTGTYAAGTANTIELYPVFDNAIHVPLTASQATRNIDRSEGSNVAQTGWLYISPSTVSNTNSHDATTTYDNFGILYNHMFRFTVANDDAVVATEVAGSYTNAGGTWTQGTLGYGNTNTSFTRLANAATSSAAAAVADSALYKNLGYMALETNNTANPDAYVYLSSDAKIMVRMGASSTTINAYNGLSELPGDVTIPTGTEVDWTDTDGDGRADVVYIGNGSIPSTVTYGLFYYEGGTAIWDGATSTGTIAGYLNGEAETITFSNRTQFNTVQNSANYAAHLFALQFTNGTVSNVMVADNKSQGGTDYLAYILAAEGTSYYDENGTASTVGGNASGVVLDFDADGATTTSRVDNIRAVTSTVAWAAAEQFGIGTAFGNPYNATTEAIYLRDLIGGTAPTASNGISHVTYARDSLGSRIVADYWDYTGGARAQKSFYLAPNCKVIGELEWLNIATLNCDVTLVYDTAAADAVTEIYISRDQDITPVVPEPSFSSVVTDLSQSTAANNPGGFQTALMAQPNGSVVYNDQTLPTAGASWVSNPADVLYFTFYCASAGSTASLEIKDSSGATRYLESGGTIPAGNHFFSVNISDATTANNGNWIGGVGLAAGTYTYTVTVNGVATSNTFTVNWG